MKYRIIEENNTFFPEFRAWPFWVRVGNFNTSVCAILITQENNIGAFNIDDAKTIVKEHALKNTKIIHEVEASD